MRSAVQTIQLDHINLSDLVPGQTILIEAIGLDKERVEIAVTATAITYTHEINGSPYVSMLHINEVRSWNEADAHGSALGDRFGDTVVARDIATGRTWDWVIREGESVTTFDVLCICRVTGVL